MRPGCGNCKHQFGRVAGAAASLPDGKPGRITTVTYGCPVVLRWESPEWRVPNMVQVLRYAQDDKVQVRRCAQDDKVQVLRCAQDDIVNNTQTRIEP